jgi:alpha-tubulin suppressor-like RCC1 family protein
VLALTTSGRVFAWGKGDYGQLGVGRPGNWDAPRLVEALGDADVVAVHAGGWHSAALLSGGQCFAWGRGEYGRLGMGEDQADKQRPTLVTFPPFAETRETPVSADSLETQEKKNTRTKPIVDVALGGSHSCFLDSGGAVWTVGRNNHGRLGKSRARQVDGDARARCVSPAQGGRRVGVRIDRRGRETHARRRASRVIV